MTDVQETTVESTSQAKTPFKSYGDIVWEQFKKYKLSYYSLWGVVGLFVLAIVAPALALNVPFFIYIPAGTPGVADELVGLSFPWVWSLFDHGFFESGVDIFFNSLFFTVPVAMLVWVPLAKSRRAVLDAQDFKVFRVKYVLGAGAALFLGRSLIHISEPTRPY